MSTRREFLIGTAGVIAAAAVPSFTASPSFAQAAEPKKLGYALVARNRSFFARFLFTKEQRGQ